VQPAVDLRIHIEPVGLSALPEIRRLNEEIFREARVINQFDRSDLTMLMAYAGDEAVGFKVGYGETRSTFYSAKGGVLDGWRRQGVARALLYAMMDAARDLRYRRFAYDTFPNMHPGMTQLGLAEGFRVTAAGFNATYQDYRLRFEKAL
jgi:GNAT superfamily N-acetyltransferase